MKLWDTLALLKKVEGPPARNASLPTGRQAKL
jgi:hypothetical protein